MKKTLIVGAICLSLASLTACGNEEASSEASKNEIVIHIPKEKSRNLERFETFSQNVKDKKNDEIHIKNYLIDEEAKVPSVDTVTYQNEKFTFIHKYKNDNRKDICNKFVTPQETHGLAYMLRDCTQSEDGIILQYTAKDGGGSHSIKNKPVEFIEVEGDKKYIFVKDLEIGDFLNAIKFTHFDTPTNPSNIKEPNFKINVHYLNGTTQTYHLWIDKDRSKALLMDPEQIKHGHEIDKIFVDNIIKALK